MREFQPIFATVDLREPPEPHVYLRLMIDGAPSQAFSAVTLRPSEIPSRSPKTTEADHAGHSNVRLMRSKERFCVSMRNLTNDRRGRQAHNLKVIGSDPIPQPNQ